MMKRHHAYGVLIFAKFVLDHLGRSGASRGKPFVAGLDFSMADITPLEGLIFAELLKVPLPDGCEALAAWHAQMRERSVVQGWRTMSD